MFNANKFERKKPKANKSRNYVNWSILCTHPAKMAPGLVTMDRVWAKFKLSEIGLRKVLKMFTQFND
ncbi:hypothetical protein BpHYR1_054578 [Brachionus plicatilis]|uniref:Uncharacterized protein n=1 Tax=Brachionus plicatilis TaxID=10195 RepID=A0A3M7R738_BRAPC|nr:hypothetical protein BpHYR1_054578 [Brachionus plicatilis]